MKKEIFSNVFVIVLTAIFILCANFAYYDMTKKIYFELMFIVLIAMGIYEIIDGIKNKKNEKGEKDNAEIYYRYKSKLCTELK